MWDFIIGLVAGYVIAIFRVWLHEERRKKREAQDEVAI